MNAEATLERAETLFDLGRYAPCAALLGPHIASHPDDAEALNLLARCLRRLGDKAGALRAVDDALRCDPMSRSSWIVRADTLADFGAMADAERSAREAIRLDPGHWGGHATLASVLSRANSGRGSRGDKRRGREAYDCARHAVSLAPETAYAHCLVGITAHELRQYKIAEEAYRTALRLDPEDATARHNLALLELKHRFRRRGAWSRAVEGFAEAASLDLEDRDARYNLEVMAWRTAASARWIGSLALGIALATQASGTDGMVVGLPLFVAVWAAWGLWIRRRVPQRLRTPMLQLARRCPPVMTMACAVGWLGTVGLVLAAVPGLPDWSMGALVTPTIWLMFLAYWISRSMLKRRMP